MDVRKWNSKMDLKRRGYVGCSCASPWPPWRPVPHAVHLSSGLQRRRPHPRLLPQEQRPCPARTARRLRVNHALGVKSRTAKGRSVGRGCCCTGGGRPGAADGLHGRTPPPTNRVHLHRWAAPGAGRRPRRKRRGGAASPDEWRGTALIQFN